VVFAECLTPQALIGKVYRLTEKGNAIREEMVRGE